MPRVAALVAVTALALVVPVVAYAGPRASDAQWEQVARCESGGNWHLNTGNGYYGGLQVSSSTWSSYGGHQYASRADLASRAEQIDVGNRIYAADGWAPWPTCGPSAGSRARHR